MTIPLVCSSNTALNALDFMACILKLDGWQSNQLHIKPLYFHIENGVLAVLLPFTYFQNLVFDGKIIVNKR